MLLKDKETCKIALNDAHCVKSVRIRSYSGPHFPVFRNVLSVKSRKYVRLQWKHLLYDFASDFLLLFSLAFTKLLKVRISVLRKLKVKIIIYMLLMTSSLEDLLMAKDTLTFILEHLGFLVNIKKLIVDSVGMPLSLPKEKAMKVQNQCKEILEKGF